MWEENCMAFSHKPRLETNQIKNWKNKRLITNIPTNKISDLRNLIYAGAKLVGEKVRFPQKNTDKMAKPGWEIRLGTPIRNLR